MNIFSQIKETSNFIYYKTKTTVSFTLEEIQIMNHGKMQRLIAKEITFAITVVYMKFLHLLQAQKLNNELSIVRSDNQQLQKTVKELLEKNEELIIKVSPKAMVRLIQ